MTKVSFRLKATLTLALFAAVVTFVAFGRTSLSSDVTREHAVSSAQEAPVQVEPEAGSGASPAFGSIVRMLGALLVVVVLLYASVYLLKRFMAGRLKTGRVGMLSIVETVHLGPKLSLSLVKVGSRGVLVGVTEHGMSALTEISESELATVEKEKAAGAQSGFAEAMKSAADKLRDFSARSVIASAK